MAKDPAVLAHQEWLGYVQPAGLVVSIPALMEARAFLNRNFAPDHRRFLDALPANRDGEPVPEIADFPAFACAVLGWGPEDLWGALGAPDLPASLEAPLPEYSETLRPTYALREFEPKEGSAQWILLVHELPTGTDFDAVAMLDSHRWQASPQARFERLLRETRVPTGLMVNGRQIRLVYAPRGEASGHITFNLPDMVQVPGRPIFAALHMLLSSERLYSVAENERLPAILASSRKYQNVVSTQLAGQVLEALYELLRGFQAADDQTHGDLLRTVLKDDPNHVYAGLLTTLLRLVFVLYAEDRGLVSTDPVYANNYSVTGLYERLRADAGRYPDTMDQRYGAWAQLLALFRLIYRGGQHGAMRIPAREGYLFDPDRYLFLEGRQQRSDQPAIPRVPDGVLYRVLSKLVVLEGERLSYRTLAVEQIGSVYEAIMGFDLHVAQGPSIAIRPAKKHGAPATINLEELLRLPGDKRQKWLAETTDQKLSGQAADSLKKAATIDDVLAALERKIARNVTPNVAPRGAMIFQPSNERRRSGSHYTPSTLTGPIVEAALRPVLRQLGDAPTPEQILNLKVCDPAMGSGAFLVEACRQLGEALVKAWHTHNQAPVVPPDEDELLFAMRQVSQRCLYGVDKNPLAADLAKLSLWLATLAKDHPFTFVDHLLRPGDSLAGLTRRQIAAFHWLPEGGTAIVAEALWKDIERVTENRRRILSAADDTPYATLRQKLDSAEQALEWPRLAGDTVLAAFFSADKPKPREEARKRLRQQFEAALKTRGSKPEFAEPVDDAVAALRRGPKGLAPFHWELEFPEVFTVDDKGNVTGGFDVVVGNPPFMGGRLISGHLSDSYLSWLLGQYEGAGGQADLVAYFFRRGFQVIRLGGTFGLIATNTISQGDTRRSGLSWICRNGGTIYDANKRIKWPGVAAVVVSTVHAGKVTYTGPKRLNGTSVERITAYLFGKGSSEDPSEVNRGISFKGMEPYGHGFFFDDTDDEATPLSAMEEIVAANPECVEYISPYIGGSELLSDPAQRPYRYVINFGDMSLEEASRFPTLLKILEQKVRPDRLTKAREVATWPWWQFWRVRNELRTATMHLKRQLVHPFTSTHLAFSFVPTSTVVASPHVVIARDGFDWFAVLQSRVHETWARFMSSSMKDDLRYAPTDCFETFPFPIDAEEDHHLQEVGRRYYESRTGVMQTCREGLTTIYNWFNDRDCDCREILHLRESHEAMDRAVLDAYSWTDIQAHCEFIPEFDDEEEEDENGRPRRKRYRYRWPDDIRDEVLARLLELNRQRALEEGRLPVEPPVFAGTTAADPERTSGKKKRGRKASANLNLSLLPQGEES